MGAVGETTDREVAVSTNEIKGGDSVASAEEDEGSEFGAGLVVCLAKFSAHLENDRCMRIIHAGWWKGADQEKRLRWAGEARQHPRGDSAEIVGDAKSVFWHGGTDEKDLSQAIVMWMNGASDHLYDIDESAPEPLKELAAFCLHIGHGFTDEIWTLDDLKRIHELWQEACLALDQRLGVKADWGQW